MLNMNCRLFCFQSWSFSCWSRFLEGEAKNERAGTRYLWLAPAARPDKTQFFFIFFGGATKLKDIFCIE